MKLFDHYSCQESLYIYIVVVQYLYHTMAMKYNLHMYTFYQAAIISARHNKPGIIQSI